MIAKWTITDEQFEQVKQELRETVNGLLEFYKETNDMEHYAQALERAFGIEDALSAIIMKAKFEISFDNEEV